MVTAVAGMVDPVRLTEITAAVSRTRASVLLASDCIYDSELLRCPSRKKNREGKLVRILMKYVSL